LGVDPENVGLLLNCEPIPASSMISDGLDLPNGDKPFFNTDQTEGLFDVSDLLLPGENTLSVYLRNWGGPAGVQYKFAFSFDQCPRGQELVPIEDEPGEVGVAEHEFECVGTGLPPLSEMFMESSGTVNVDGEDPRITYQQGPFATGFGGSIEDVCNNVRGDFPSGGNAFIVPPFVADPGIPAQKDWKAHLDIDPTAEYVSNSATGNEIGGGARTALFTHTFDAGTVITPLDEAFLIFHYLSDNDLGVDPENVGLLLNCVPIPNSAMISDGQDLPDGNKPFFNEDQTEGLFDVSDLLLPGENTLSVYLRNWGGPAGVQYKFAFSFDQCPSGAAPEPIPESNGVVTQEHGFQCTAPSTTSGASGHEPPTIGKSLDGVRQVVASGMSVDGQTWTVTQGYHQEFELLQMLTSPHTISNVINCSKGVQYCNYIAVGFMGLTDDFNNPVMTVSASKDHLGSWTLDWYDPDDYISDPSDAAPADIVFVPQIIDDKLLGTSFTIDFKNKDTGQLKLGIQVRDSYHGVRNFFFNEGVEFVDADAYPAVETAYESPIEVEPLCFGQNNPDRNSCQFSKMKDWATENAEETLRQMMGNQYQYDQ